MLSGWPDRIVLEQAGDARAGSIQNQSRLVPIENGSAAFSLERQQNSIRSMLFGGGLRGSAGSLGIQKFAEFTSFESGTRSRIS